MLPKIYGLSTSIVPSTVHVTIKNHEVLVEISVNQKIVNQCLK